MSVRLAHAWSSDLGVAWAAPYDAPLLARGWDVCHLSPDGPAIAPAAARGARWLPLEFSRSIDPRGDVRAAAAFARHLLRERFDVVHTHNIKVGLVGRVLASAARVPVVVHTLHGLAYSLETPRAKRALHAALERLANLRVDAVLAQAREDARTLVATGAIAPEKVVWVGNGIDLARFRPGAVGDEARAAVRAAMGVAKGDVLFLTAGRLVREKGVVELAEGAVEARRADPRVRLAIAGEIDREKPDAIDARFVDAMRAAGVIFLGRRSDMPELYAAADVVALASWREGMPRVLMEGAAMGKPLLASDARGCREVVRPPANGVLVPARDAGALARAMLALAGDPALRERLGRENAAEARELYDVHRVAARVVDVYDRLLAARPNAAARARNAPTDSPTRARAEGTTRPKDPP